MPTSSITMEDFKTYDEILQETDILERELQRSIPMTHLLKRISIDRMEEFMVNDDFFSKFSR